MKSCLSGTLCSNTNIEHVGYFSYNYRTCWPCSFPVLSLKVFLVYCSQTGPPVSCAGLSWSHRWSSPSSCPGTTQWMWRQSSLCCESPLWLSLGQRWQSHQSPAWSDISGRLSYTRRSHRARCRCPCWRSRCCSHWLSSHNPLKGMSPCQMVSLHLVVNL